MNINLSIVSNVRQAYQAGTVDEDIYTKPLLPLLLKLKKAVSEYLRIIIIIFIICNKDLF